MSTDLGLMLPLATVPAHPPAAASLGSNLSALEGAAAKGSAADAKRGFVAAVGSIKAWASAANVAGDLKGL
jgi:hypothetical protein